MPIVVRCGCGKDLRVKDESRGKKVRCPICQAILVAEEADDSPPSPPTVAPRRAVAAVGSRRPSRPGLDEDEGEELEAPRRGKRAYDDAPDRDDERPSRRPRRDEDEEEDRRPVRRSRRDEEHEDDR